MSFTTNSFLLKPKETYQQLTDEELLLRYRQTGDNYWLGIILERYTMLLLGVAFKYLKDKTAAEDAVQFVFLKALTQLPEGEINNFKGWLYVIVRNYCLQNLKTQKHHSPAEEVDIRSHDNELLEATMLKELTLEQLEHALTELNEEQRITIHLFYWQKLSYQQISDTTGFDFNQVKSFIQNGKRNLKLIILKKMERHNS